MPLGKDLAKKDKGEFTLAVYISGDQIVLDFQEDMSWMSMGASEARALVEVLEKRIKEVEEQ